MQLDFRWLGLSKYEEALKAQLQARDEVEKAGGELAVFIATSHKSVITLGKRSQPLKDILVPFETLRRKKIEIVNTERGGQTTFHNPGQLVIYPILPLRAWGSSVRDYVAALERTTAMLCAEFGIEVTSGAEPGLWVDNKKIAAFGIRIDRGVSLHGLALNICNSLEDFSLILKCGTQSAVTCLHDEMTSFMMESPNWDLEELARRWLEIFNEEIAAGFKVPAAEEFQMKELAAQPMALALPVSE